MDEDFYFGLMDSYNEYLHFAEPYDPDDYLGNYEYQDSDYDDDYDPRAPEDDDNE